MGSSKDDTPHYPCGHQHRRVLPHTVLGAFIEDKTVGPQPGAPTNDPGRNRRGLNLSLEVEQTLETLVGQAHFGQLLNPLFELPHLLPERIVLPTDGAEIEILIPDLPNTPADHCRAKLERKHCLK